MTTLTRATLTVVAAGFVASSCFDAHQVDPGSLTIDGFDNGAYPVDSTFMPWQCHSFNPINQNYSCAYSADTRDRTDYSLSLDYAVTDMMDGKNQYGGAGLVTYAWPGLSQDFTAFATVGFDAELSGTPAGVAQLYVELGCSTVRLTDGSQPGDVFVRQNVNPNDGWQAIALSLSNFVPSSSSPDDTHPLLQDGVPSCLQLVDRIEFDVDAGVTDGQTGAGTLNIDQIYFE